MKNVDVKGWNCHHSNEHTVYFSNFHLFNTSIPQWGMQIDKRIPEFSKGFIVPSSFHKKRDLDLSQLNILMIIRFIIIKHIFLTNFFLSISYLIRVIQ